MSCVSRPEGDLSWESLGDLSHGVYLVLQNDQVSLEKLHQLLCQWAPQCREERDVECMVRKNLQETRVSEGGSACYSLATTSSWLWAKTACQALSSPVPLGTCLETNLAFGRETQPRAELSGMQETVSKD